MASDAHWKHWWPKGDFMNTSSPFANLRTIDSLCSEIALILFPNSNTTRIPVGADCARGEEVTHQLPTHLPMGRPKIAGREEAIQETSDLIRRERLVSLVAAGGIGKTAVAISVAQYLAARLW
jgi:hypothetical protein